MIFFLIKCYIHVQTKSSVVFKNDMGPGSGPSKSLGVMPRRSKSCKAT